MPGHEEVRSGNEVCEVGAGHIWEQQDSVTDECVAGITSGFSGPSYLQWWWTDNIVICSQDPGDMKPKGVKLVKRESLNKSVKAKVYKIIVRPVQSGGTDKKREGGSGRADNVKIFMWSKMGK